MNSGNISSVFGVLNILATYESDLNSQLLQLVQLIQTQVQFSTVLMLSDSNNHPVDVSCLMNHLNIPVIHLTSTKKFQLKSIFKDDVLAIIFVTDSSYQNALNILAGNLRRMTHTKIVFVYSGMKKMILGLFKTAWKKRMIDAIAFLGDTYLTYNPFPQMQLEEHSIHENREVFSNRLSNVQGHPFRVMLDGVEPRDFVYINRKGQRTIGGYTAHFLASFAEKINATLTTPIGSGIEVLYHQDTDKLLAEDVIDIFGGLVIFLPPMRGQSNTAEVIRLCLMIPVEPKVPKYLYYPMIFKSFPMLLMFSMIVVFSLLVWCTFKVERRPKLPLIEVMLNEKCARGLLGQPFIEYPRSSMKLRCIYFHSCLLGLFFSTIYLATLNTLVTSPPSETLITSFEDIRSTPFKVFLFRPEYDEILNTTNEFEKYSDTFEFAFNNSMFHLKRNSMDTRYAYSVPTNKWKMFEEQQRMFTTPRYRITDLCLIPVVFMVFLLSENSIYFDAINQMIARTHQSGLYEHWVRMAFWELLEAKRIKLDVAGEGLGPKPLKLDDMRWLWGLFGVCASIDCGVLMMELLWHRTAGRREVFFKYWFR